MTTRSAIGALRFSATLVAAFALVACSSSTGGSVGPSASAAGTGAATTGLEGSLWQLTEYAGPDGNTVPVPAAVAASATFAGGTVSGNAGCNDYTAGYTVDGANLTIGAAATTRMACGPVATALETAYLAALSRVATYAVKGGSLELTTKEGKVGLTFAAAKAATLTGTRWVATSVNNGTGGTVSIIPETSLTAIFAADKAVAGSGGCNTYSGPYTTDGAGIKIGPLASTMKLCSSPTGIDTQESQFFAAMQKATTYAISGTKLELRDDSGALQVAFQPTLGGQ